MQKTPEIPGSFFDYSSLKVRWLVHSQNLF